MSKIIKLSELDKKLKKSIHLPIKNIKTIILDKEEIYWIDENKYSMKLNNIIISKDLINRIYTDIRIYKTNAKNIYIEGIDNLGGITIPYNIIEKSIDIYITFNKDTEINKINIINNKNSTINLSVKPLSIRINKEEQKMSIYVESNKEIIKYIVDKLGNVEKNKNTYILDDNDIVDNNLDLTKFTEYDHLKFPDKEINTIIINKHYIENTHKLSKLNDNQTYIPFHKYLYFNSLRIIDDNNMKLLPKNIVLENIRNKNTYFISNKDNKYIYIKDKQDNNNILIYVDKNKEIKILEKKELLNNKDVEEVIINYDYYAVSHYKSPKLILIKYKDYFIVKDFDKEYIINDLFFKLLSLNVRKYFDNKDLIIALKNNDLITLFNSKELSKNLFYEMYNDFLEYKNYIDKLNKLGFTNNAIKYLFDKKFYNIINPNDNIINDLTDKEIEHFNDMANEYIKVKRLSHEKE